MNQRVPDDLAPLGLSVRRQFHHKAARLLMEKESVQNPGRQEHRSYADGQIDQGHRQGTATEEEDDQRQAGSEAAVAEDQWAGDDGDDPVLGVFDDAAGENAGYVAAETHHRYQRMLTLGAHGLHQPVKVEGHTGDKADVFQQIEGLIDHQFMYYDDVELSWLINLLGYEIYCVPKSVMYHRYELKMNPEKFQWLEYNRLSLLIRCLSRSSFIIILPFLGLTELMIAGYCLIRGKKYISSKFRSATMIIKSFKQLMEKRQGIQRLRKISDLRFFRILQFNYEWKQLLGITKE